MRKLLCLTALPLLLACQGPETPAEDVVTEASVDTPSHYAGRVEFDLAEGQIEADLLINTAPGEADGISFLLAGTLEIQDITGEGVTGFDAQPMAPGASWNQVTVELDPARNPGPLSIRFQYGGAPALPESGINQISDQWVELSVDSAWHPVGANLDKQFTLDLELGLPTGWTIVAPGTAREIEDGYSLTNTVPHADIAFAAAPDFDIAEGTGATVYHRGESDEITAAVLKAAATCRGYLDSRFGRRATLPDGRFVIPERDRSGYARKNFISLTNVEGKGEASLTGFLCHELSHFWSSGAAPLTVENWLNEGFSVLIAAQAVREHFGVETWEKSLENWTQAAAGQPSIWTADNLERRPFAVNYKKAPLALARLEEHIGATAFDTLVERYMTAPINSTPELLAALEEEAGSDARAWFEAVLAEDDSETTAE